jgi:hypothetical protein
MAVLNGMTPVGEGEFHITVGPFQGLAFGCGAADSLNFLRQASENM